MLNNYCNFPYCGRFIPSPSSCDQPHSLIIFRVTDAVNDVNKTWLLFYYKCLVDSGDRNIRSGLVPRNFTTLHFGNTTTSQWLYKG